MAFMDRLATGIQNPLFAMGVGLMQGGQPGGTFASGMQAAFQNGLITSQNARQEQLMAAQLKAAEQVQKQREMQLASQQRIRDLVGAPPQPMEGPVQPGQPPLMSTGSGLLGGSDPRQFQMGLLGEYAQTNPQAFTALMGQMQPGTPPADIQTMRFLTENPEYQGIYERMKKAGASNTTVSVGDAKLVTASDADKIRLPDGSRPPPGTRYQDLAGMDAEFVNPRTPEQAGKEQMLQIAKDRIPLISKYLFNEDGSINRMNVFNAKIGTPYTEGQTLGVAMEAGIQASTRSETGAAMHKEEVGNMRKRIQPSPLDSDMVIRLKWQMYQDFMNGSLDLIQTGGSQDPTKWRFDEKAFDAEMKKREMAQRLESATSQDGWSVQEVQ